MATVQRDHGEGVPAGLQGELLLSNLLKHLQLQQLCALKSDGESSPILPAVGSPLRRLQRGVVSQRPSPGGCAGAAEPRPVEDL